LLDAGREDAAVLGFALREATSHLFDAPIALRCLPERFRQLHEPPRPACGIEREVEGAMGCPAARFISTLHRVAVLRKFNYSEALLDVPPDVQLHTSNPAVELLTALYFHLM
jgi:hypothetical protein